MQTLGALMAVITVGWCFTRGAALKELSKGEHREVPRWLYQWIRFGIPLAIGSVGIWWLLTSVLGVFTAV
jgi:SNF family Na+-dependent transporter